MCTLSLHVQLHLHGRPHAFLHVWSLLREICCPLWALSCLALLPPWVDVLFPIITAPLLNYVFTGALFGEVFDDLFEDLGSVGASEIDLEAVGAEEVAGEEVAGEEAVTTELGEELSETRFEEFCSI